MFSAGFDPKSSGINTYLIESALHYISHSRKL